MEYVTGIYALNIPCQLETDGDWHAPALDWNNPRIKESDESLFGQWGIEYDPQPNYGNITMPVANHIRACLDLIEEGCFGSVQGMRDNFISNEAYTPLILETILLLRNNSLWSEIDAFIGKEYLCDWLDYKESKNHDR